MFKHLHVNQSINKSNNQSNNHIIQKPLNQYALKIKCFLSVLCFQFERLFGTSTSIYTEGQRLSKALKSSYTCQYIIHAPHAVGLRRPKLWNAAQINIWAADLIMGVVLHGYSMHLAEPAWLWASCQMWTLERVECKSKSGKQLI